MQHYIEMELDDALKLRWEEGVKAHRDGDDTAEWAGNPPLQECYEELLDAIHYCRVAAKRGDLTKEQGIYAERQVRSLAHEIRAAALWEGNGNDEGEDASAPAVDPSLP